MLLLLSFLDTFRILWDLAVYTIYHENVNEKLMNDCSEPLLLSLSAMINDIGSSTSENVHCVFSLT